MTFLYIGLAILSIIVVMTISMAFKVVNVVISSNFDCRYDDRHTLKYFTVDDFEDLKNEPIEFPSDKGQILKGFLYSSTKVEEKDYKGLLVVAHGLGAGHLQYTTEINYFAQEGYLVFAFDDTGCNLSEGEKIIGVTQGLIDLDYALNFIKTNERLNKLPLVIFGHSMGAFASCNITAFDHPEIKGIVALAPFKDEVSMLYEEARANGLKFKFLVPMFKGKYKKRFKPEILKINTQTSLANSDSPHFIIAGDADPIVDYYGNFDKFRKEFESKENYRFLSVPNRFHRPNLSQKAADYDNDTNYELQGMNAKYKGKVPAEELHGFYDNLDYNLLVEMDPLVMGRISTFLDECVSSKEISKVEPILTLEDLKEETSEEASEN